MKINITENVRKHGIDLKNNFKNIVTYMKDNGREKKSKKNGPFLWKNGLKYDMKMIISELLDLEKNII